MTIANPAKIAPATKNGGKMVLCKSGTTTTEKSNDTIVCTLNTSGVPRPASSRYSFSYRRQWYADPRHPRAKIPYTTRWIRVRAVSRRVAKSGTSPRYQNTSETVKYVVTANTSQARGLRNCGHMAKFIGIGYSQ